MSKRSRVVVLLWLGACARAEQVPAKTAIDSAPVTACSCPQPPGDDLPVSPTHEQVFDAMKMARPGVRECVRESGTVRVAIAVDGPSGMVVDVFEVDSPQAGSEGCIARAMRRICFPRFQKPVFKIRFPYKVGPRSRRDRGVPATPGCPASAAPWSAEVQRADEVARASARKTYQAKYGATCEVALAGQPPVPSEPLPPAIAADVKKSVLNARIDEVHGCYRDALEGWPDLAGEIDLELVIDATGVVESSHVSTSTFAMPELGCCLRQVTRTLQFPAPRARTSIRYDFSFRP